MEFKVIADHIRTLTFALSDGASFENYGRGFVWSKNDASPTLENYDDYVYADYYENDYSCEIYNLNSNTVYYVRAFVHTSMGHVYSDVLSFKTLE